MTVFSKDTKASSCFSPALISKSNEVFWHGKTNYVFVTNKHSKEQEREK